MLKIMDLALLLLKTGYIPLFFTILCFQKVPKLALCQMGILAGNALCQIEPVSVVSIMKSNEILMKSVYH